MAQSLFKIITHIVFSTKNHEPLLHHDILPELYCYITKIITKHNCSCYQIGGVSNHIHLACTLPKNILVSDLVKEIKASTSLWLKTQNQRLGNFYWQRGYGAFSVSPSHLQGLCKYIATQHKHHQGIDFQSEYLMLLKKYSMNYTEKYLWN